MQVYGLLIYRLKEEIMILTGYTAINWELLVKGLQQTNGWRCYQPQLLSLLICVGYLPFRRSNSKDCICFPVPASLQTCLSQWQFHFTLIMWLEVTKDLACICFYPSCSKGCSLKQRVGVDMQEQVTSPTASRFVWAHLLEGSVCCRDQEVFLWSAMMACCGTFSMVGEGIYFWAVLSTLHCARAFIDHGKAFCITEVASWNFFFS